VTVRTRLIESGKPPKQALGTGTISVRRIVQWAVEGWNPWRSRERKQGRSYWIAGTSQKWAASCGLGCGRIPPNSQRREKPVWNL